MLGVSLDPPSATLLACMPPLADAPLPRPRALTPAAHLPLPPALAQLPLAAVHLMSLRSQLQAPAPAARPQLLATLTPDVAPNEATPACTAVAWVPSTDVFVAAFSNGLINVYKKVSGGQLPPSLSSPSLSPSLPSS